MNQYCPDLCPTCGANLKSEGFPVGHQHAATGGECTFRWDVEAALDAEAKAEAEMICGFELPDGSVAYYSL